MTLSKNWLSDSDVQAGTDCTQARTNFRKSVRGDKNLTVLRLEIDGKGETETEKR